MTGNQHDNRSSDRSDHVLCSRVRLRLHSEFDILQSHTPALLYSHLSTATGAVYHRYNTICVEYPFRKKKHELMQTAKPG